MAKAVAITTDDNPYDPFTQFDEWNAYDQQKNYFTCSYLAEFAYTSPELSDTDQALAIEFAIDEIIKHNPLRRYKKVYKEM